MGLLFTSLGAVLGAFHWYRSLRHGLLATSGTVMLAALPVIIGVQFLLAFIQHDVSNVPRIAIHGMFRRAVKVKARALKEEGTSVPATAPAQDLNRASELSARGVLR
jgi:hypothetical protein